MRFSFQFKILAVRTSLYLPIDCFCFFIWIFIAHYNLRQVRLNEDDAILDDFLPLSDYDQYKDKICSRIYYLTEERGLEVDDYLLSET